MIEFFIPGEPPRTTAQQKKVAVVNGKPRFYETDKVKAAKQYLRWGVKKHAPKKPFDKAVGLSVQWHFGCKSKNKHGEWKTTRPDTDNLQKLLKDVLTDMGYWVDDSYVCYEQASKMWSNKPGINIKIWELV